MPTTPTTYAEQTRTVPDLLIGLDRVDLISSGNVALSTCLLLYRVSALFCGCPGMSLGMPMAPAGVSTVPGMGMNPSAGAGLGMPPGLGLGAPSSMAADATAVMGLGSAPAATATVAAPPIATECLLVSNLFDPSK